VRERDAHVRLGRVESPLEVGAWYPQLVDPAPVESFGELTERGVAARTNVFDDGARLFVDAVGCGRRREDGVEVGRASAKVESGEHGGHHGNRHSFSDCANCPAMLDATRLSRVSTASDLAELSSLRAQVTDVIERVVQIADRYRTSDDTAVTAELDAGERALMTARRALEHAASVLQEMTREQ
jgi:hypothetical protein